MTGTARPFTANKNWRCYRRRIAARCRAWLKAAPSDAPP
jgi:hypothetical protein